MNLVELNIEKIKNLCAKHKVSKLFVFGSVLKDTFTNESDIDLVVDFEKLDQLESIFNRPVDLLEEKGIRNPFLRKQIDNEKRLIYG
jgi:predicted nucleotidyltransferase